LPVNTQHYFSSMLRVFFLGEWGALSQKKTTTKNVKLRMEERVKNGQKAHLIGTFFPINGYLSFINVHDICTIFCTLAWSPEEENKKKRKRNFSKVKGCSPEYLLLRLCFYLLCHIVRLPVENSDS